MTDDLQEFYRCEATDYHAIRYGSWYGGVFARLHHAVLRQALEPLAPVERILDVATGTGHSLDVLQEAGKAVYATDLTIEMLQACRARKASGSAIRYLVSNALALPFPDATFDAVNSSRFLHLLSKSEQCKALAELSRVLKPGGTLIVDFYNQSHWSLLGFPIAIYRYLRKKRPTGDTLNAPGEVSSWIKACGLQPGRLAGIGSYSLIVFRLLPPSLAAKIGRCFGSGVLLPLAEQFAVIARKNDESKPCVS